MVASYFIDHGTTEEFVAAIRATIDRVNLRDVERELGLDSSAQVNDIVFASQATRGSLSPRVPSPSMSQDRYSPYDPPNDWVLTGYDAALRRNSASPDRSSARSASPRRGHDRVTTIRTERRGEQLKIEYAVEELCKAVRDVGWEFWNGRGIPTLETLMELVTSPLNDVGMTNKKSDLLKMLDLQPTPEMRVDRHREMRGLWARSGRDASTCPKCWRYAQTDCTWNLCSHHCVDIAGLGVSCDEDYHVAREADTGEFCRIRLHTRRLMASQSAWSRCVCSSSTLYVRPTPLCLKS